MIIYFKAGVKIEMMASSVPGKILLHILESDGTSITFPVDVNECIFLTEELTKIINLAKNKDNQ